jgi:hypothetical protein
LRRPRITYANVVSTLALFLAIGGVSWAAATLPKNSVGSKQLKKNAVISAKIKAGAVTASKLKSGAVTAAKLAPGAVSAGQLADGSLGSSKLADGAVTAGKIADGAVGAGKIADGAVGASKLANNAVNGTTIADGSVGFGDLSGDLQNRAVAAYASIDGFGPTIQQPYNKNVTGVTRYGAGGGKYCLAVDWAAAGRTPAQQATPVIVTARDGAYIGSGDVYNGVCPNNGVRVTLSRAADGANNDGWVHVIIP